MVHTAQILISQKPEIQLFFYKGKGVLHISQVVAVPSLLGGARRKLHRQFSYSPVARRLMLPTLMHALFDTQFG